MVGQWLAERWSMVGQWLDNGWPMVGQWLTTCFVSSCPILACLDLSCLVLCCLALSRLVLSYLVLSCLVLYCLVFSCLVLSYLVLSLHYTCQCVGQYYLYPSSSSVEAKVLAWSRSSKSLHSCVLQCPVNPWRGVSSNASNTCT